MNWKNGRFEWESREFEPLSVNAKVLGESGGPQ